MSKLLLLVQSESDVTHLDAAAKAITHSAITGIWVVFSPALTVNSSEAAAKLDTEIEQLRTAEKQAAERADYEAAKGYKTQREGKELDRAAELRDAWKKASVEERKAKTDAIFKPFVEQIQPGRNVRVTMHSDHHDREQWVTMLNSLSGVWFKPFTPGSFIVAWPESVETSIMFKSPTVPTPPPAPVLTPSEKQEQAKAAQRLPQVPKVELSRKDELMGLRHFGLVAEAKKVGVDVKGKSKTSIVDEILAAEAGAATPEPVEAY